MLNPQIQSSRSNIKAQKQLRAIFTNFLQSWTDSNGEKKYINAIERLSKQTSYKLLISFHDFCTYNYEVALSVFNQYHKYEHVLNMALTEFIKESEKALGVVQKEQETAREYYEVAFDKGFADDLEDSIRGLKCQMLGKLRSITGTVTRVSEVRPQLIVGVFKCGYCGKLSDRIIQQYKYTTPKRCQSPICQNNSDWQLNNTHSLFADFQKVRLQQESTKIPPGSMPRSIQIILRNENIQKGQPGDRIHVVGYLNVIPQITSLLKPGQRTMLSSYNSHVRRQPQQQGVTGIKGIRQLNYKLCFIGSHVFVMNNQFNQDILTQQEQEPAIQEYDQQQIISRLYKRFSQTQKLEIKRIKENPKIYDDIASSLFHQIYGHSEIKKALLLQLLGGIHKKTANKISIRGDVNILIVGDPSTAKSQFLKCINKFVPRSVYTNGKTTTAAGLTASIIRDQETGNISIEAGALLLADNGICCIDEFDKMQLKDQVAIHEAMQQQTISIAKAGVQATLHARTSILAAANPIFGRYDKSQSLRQNINISPPIMSRFDLFFIICDEINQVSDQNLSEFIVRMHHGKKLQVTQKPYSIQQIKSYLSIARKVKPRLTRQAAEQLTKCYSLLRTRDKQLGNTKYQVTVRQLQSMIRLSQALAKLHLDMQVKYQYVRQAYRLLECSIVKLQKGEMEISEEFPVNNDKTSFRIFSMLNQTQRIAQKKQKKFTIEHDVYQQLKRSIEELFRQKQTRHRQDRIEDVQLYLTHQDVMSYLYCVDMQNVHMDSQQKTNKVYNAIINKLIKQKMLMIIQDCTDMMKRKLSLHPNYESIFSTKQFAKNPDQLQQESQVKIQW